MEGQRREEKRPPTDGAFERFISSAIATILTIVFSWRLLLEVQQTASSTPAITSSSPQKEEEKKRFATESNTSGFVSAVAASAVNTSIMAAAEARNISIIEVKGPEDRRGPVPLQIPPPPTSPPPPIEDEIQLSPGSVKNVTSISLTGNTGPELSSESDPSDEGSADDADGEEDRKPVVIRPSAVLDGRNYLLDDYDSYVRDASLLSRQRYDRPSGDIMKICAIDDISFDSDSSDSSSEAPERCFLIQKGVVECDSSSESEHCNRLNRPLPMIAEEDTEDLVSTDKENSNAQALQKPYDDSQLDEIEEDDGMSTECEVSPIEDFEANSDGGSIDVSYGKNDPQGDSMLPINTHRPLSIGTYTDRNSSFVKDRFIVAGNKPQELIFESSHKLTSSSDTTPVNEVLPSELGSNSENGWNKTFTLDNNSAGKHGAELSGGQLIELEHSSGTQQLNDRVQGIEGDSIGRQPTTVRFLLEDINNSSHDSKEPSVHGSSRDSSEEIAQELSLEENSVDKAVESYQEVSEINEDSVNLPIQDLNSEKDTIGLNTEYGSTIVNVEAKPSVLIDTGDPRQESDKESDTSSHHTYTVDSDVETNSRKQTVSPTSESKTSDLKSLHVEPPKVEYYNIVPKSLTPSAEESELSVSAATPSIPVTQVSPILPEPSKSSGTFNGEVIYRAVSSDNLELSPVLSVVPSKECHDVSLQTNLEPHEVVARRYGGSPPKFVDAELSGCLERNPKSFSFVRDKSVERDFMVVRTTRYRYGSVPSSESEFPTSKPQIMNETDGLSRLYEPGEGPSYNNTELKAGFEYEEYNIRMGRDEVENLISGGRHEGKPDYYEPSRGYIPPSYPTDVPGTSYDELDRGISPTRYSLNDRPYEVPRYGSESMLPRRGYPYDDPRHSAPSDGMDWKADPSYSGPPRRMTPDGYNNRYNGYSGSHRDLRQRPISSSNDWKSDTSLSRPYSGSLHRRRPSPLGASMDFDQTFFQPPEPPIGRARAHVSPKVPRNVPSFRSPRSYPRENDVILSTSCVMKDDLKKEKVSVTLDPRNMPKGAIARLPYQIERQEQERAQRLAQLQGKKISITIEQNRKGTLEREQKTVECNVPGNSHDQDLTSLISQIVKNILTSESSPIPVPKSGESRQAWDEAVDRVSRQVLNSMSSSVSSTPVQSEVSSPKEANLSEASSSKPPRPAVGGSKFFYVTGTGRVCPEESAVADDVVLCVETDDETPSHADPLSGNESQETDSSWVKPNQSQSEPTQRHTQQQTQAKLAQKHAQPKQPQTQSQPKPTQKYSQPKPPMEPVMEAPDLAKTSASNTQAAPATPAKEPIPEPKAFQIEPKVHSKLPETSGIKNSLSKIEQMINERIQDQEDIKQAKLLNGPKPYDSVLKKPVSDGPTPLDELKRFEVPEKNLPNCRLKINESRKSFIAEEKAKKAEQPVSSMPGRSPRRSSSGLMVVDIDIDDIPRVPRDQESTNRREEIKKRLQSHRPRAPPPLPIDKHWNASEIIKKSKSQGNKLNTVGVKSPSPKIGDIPASPSPSQTVTRSKSLSSVLPQDFFSNRASFTNLIETDIDTGECKQTPLIHETNLDSAHFKTQSLTNLTAKELKTCEFPSGFEERPKSMVIYNDDEDHNEVFQEGVGLIDGEYHSHSKSAHELRISQSLNKLDIPSWYRQSDVPPVSVGLTNTHRDLSVSVSEHNTSQTESMISPRSDSGRSAIIIKHRVSAPAKIRSPYSSAPSTPSESTPMFELPSERLRRQGQSKSIKPIKVRSLEDILADRKDEPSESCASTQRSQSGDDLDASIEHSMRALTSEVSVNNSHVNLSSDNKPITDQSSQVETEPEWPPPPADLLLNTAQSSHTDNKITDLTSSEQYSTANTDFHLETKHEVNTYEDAQDTEGGQDTEASEDLPTYEESPTFGRRLAKKYLINSEEPEEHKPEENMTLSRNKGIMNGSRQYEETDLDAPYEINGYTSQQGLHARGTLAQTDAPHLYKEPETYPKEEVVYYDSVHTISHEERLRYTDFMRPLQIGNGEDTSSQATAKSSPPERQKNAFPILTYSDSPTTDRKNGDNRPPFSETKRIQVTMTKTDLGKNNKSASDSKDRSLEEVMDGLLALRKEPASDESTTAPSSDYEDTPQGRIFTLLRSAHTPQESLNSINTRSSDSLLSPVHDDPPISPWDRSIESEARDKMTEEVVIVKCRNPKCKKSTELQEARQTYKNCHNCYTYYCSRECRKAHWERHKKKCHYSRVNSACKHVIKKAHDNEELAEFFTRIARTGYLSKGRGCVMIVFTSLEKAERFVTAGLEGIELSPSYIAMKDLQDVDVFGDHMFELIDMTKQYKPDIKYVLDVAIVAGKEIPSWPMPRREGPTIKKCAKLRLHTPQGKTPRSRDSETLILTACPGSEYLENMEERKAREVCFINMQKKLRQRGISLRHQFPDVYNRLCSYVADNEHFSPMTIYPVDANTGKRFMCLIMPNSEAEVEWMHNPYLMEDLGLSTSV